MDLTTRGPSSTTNHATISNSSDISAKDAAHNAHSKQDAGGSTGKIILFLILGVCVVLGLLTWSLKRKPKRSLGPDETPIVDENDL